MSKAIPNSLKLPSWIEDKIPRDLYESTLFRFNLTLQVEELDPTSGKKLRKKITIDLLPVLDLDYEYLEIQMQELPAQYAFYSAVYSEARMTVELMERAIKARKGNIVQKMVMEGKENSIKFTADQVKVIMESDQGLIDLDNKFQKLQMQAGKLYHVLEALKMKAELARSLSGFKRQEQSQSN